MARALACSIVTMTLWTAACGDDAVPPPAHVEEESAIPSCGPDLDAPLFDTLPVDADAIVPHPRRRDRLRPPLPPLRGGDRDVPARDEPRARPPGAARRRDVRDLRVRHRDDRRLQPPRARGGGRRRRGAAYLEAVQGAPPKEARDLRRRAAGQMLHSGAIDEGIALGRALLRDAGVSYPEGRAAAIAAVAVQKILLSMRGFGFTERALGPEDDDDKHRVDLLYTMGASLRTIDVLRGAYLQTRHARAALALGEPSRVARGLALVATSIGAEGKQGAAQRSEELGLRACELAHRIDDPQAIAPTYGTLSALDWFAARWRRSLEHMHDLVTVTRERCPERVWELPLAEIFVTMRSLFALGELDEMESVVLRCTRSAVERGDDVVLAMAQSVGTTKVHLRHGRLDEARRVAADGIAAHRGGPWHLAHQEGLRAQLACDLYAGDGRGAMERIASSWKAVQDSLLLHSQPERIQSFTQYASAALLAQDDEAAERWLKKLAREDQPWPRAHAQAVRAGLLALRGAPAADAYESAALQFDALEMPLYAAAARRRFGGADDDAMVARGVVEPEAFARVLVV